MWWKNYYWIYKIDLLFLFFFFVKMGLCDCVFGERREVELRSYIIKIFIFIEKKEI